VIVAANAVLTVAVAVAALVIVGAWSTVKVKAWVADFCTTLVAVRVTL